MNDTLEEKEDKRRLAGTDAQLLLDSIIPYQINLLSYRMNRLLDQDLRAQGMSISVWRIMAVLDYSSEMNVKDLAQYAMIEQSTLSRMLKKLVADGLVENRRSGGDGRVHAITLTESGRQRYHTIRDVALAHVGRITRGFSAKERAQLAHYVKRMQQNLEGTELDAP